MPQTINEFFECAQIDMQVDQSKDSLGNFVERYINLFISEIKFFVETYSDEIKQRLVR